MDEWQLGAGVIEEKRKKEQDRVRGAKGGNEQAL